MKVLYILKREQDETLKIIMGEHKKSCDVTVVKLSENRDYNLLVDLIESSDKVICW